jgi:hypothetical protein
MNSNKKRVIAVICLLVFIVGIFVACKKKEEEELVSVSTDENGSLYYTDPTYVIDGIEYGGETHFVKPEETNSNGEYKVGDVTSAPYTTDNQGNVAPISSEPSTTAPAENTTTTAQNNGSATTTTQSSGGNGGSTTTTTQKPSDGDETKPTAPDVSEVLSTAGIDGIVDNNNLNNDGVIIAW